jgi:hypothetical protein
MRDCMIKACFCWCCFLFTFRLGFLFSWFRVLGDLGFCFHGLGF